MIDLRSQAHTLLKQLWNFKRPEKNSGLNGIQTHDLCDTCAVLYGPLLIELSSHLGAGHVVSL